MKSETPWKTLWRAWVIFTVFIAFCFILFLFADAFALSIDAHSLNPTNPKPTENVSFNMTLLINSTTYRVIDNYSNQTACYNKDKTSISCNSYPHHSIDIKLYIDNQLKNHQQNISCTKTATGENVIYGYNISDASENCTTTNYTYNFSCFSETKYLTPLIFNTNLTYLYQALGDTEASENGTLTVQDFNVSASSPENDKDGEFEITGSVLWTDGNALKGRWVELNSSICEYQRTETLSNGAYSLICSYDIFIPSDNYSIDVISYYDQNNHREGNTSILLYGNTSANLTIDPDSLEITDVSKVSTKSIIISWEKTEGNSVEAVDLEVTVFDKDYKLSCPKVTGTEYSTCSKIFDIEIPEKQDGGSYTLTGKANWTTDTGCNSSILRTALVKVFSSPVFTVSKDSLTFKDVGVGVTKSETFDITSNGNEEMAFSLSTDLKEISINSKEFTLGIGKTETINITVDVPYDTTGEEVKGKIWVRNNFGNETTIPVTLTTIQPWLYWEPETQALNSTDLRFSFNATLKNKYSPSENITITVDCPDVWKCALNEEDNITFFKVNDEKTFSVDVSATYSPVTTTTIALTAEDSAGRKATHIVTSSNFTGKILTTGEMLTVNLKKYDKTLLYFIDTEMLKAKPEIKITGISPRTQRSTAGEWTVSLADDSRGIPDVCDVFVYVDGINKSYKVDPDTSVITTLSGDIGADAYEYLIFHKDGECRVHLKYSDAETLAYIVLGSPQYSEEETQIASLHELTGKLSADLEEEKEWRTNMMGFGAIALLIILVILLIFTQKHKLTEMTYESIKKKVKGGLKGLKNMDKRAREEGEWEAFKR